jgi:glucosylceramidase
MLKQIVLLGLMIVGHSNLVMEAAAASSLLTSRVLLTSAEGHQQAELAAVTFSGQNTASAEVRVVIDDKRPRQTITGIGTSFTESSAFVLAHLDQPDRLVVMRSLFAEDGANFSLARTMIGASDFSVEGRYDYAPVPDDFDLDYFSIVEDLRGFPARDYPGIVDDRFDLLPMIREALTIKSDQADAQLNIIASAWTAPPWMKDIDDYYRRGTPETNYQGTGGSLKTGYEEVYADYLLRYLDAYRQEGVPIWGLTPVNEPEGNSGQWESMHFTPETQAVFVGKHLGPKLRAQASDIKLLIYDQNRDQLEHWTDVLLNDTKASPYIYGTAIHWYASTVDVFGDVLDRVHQKFPDKDLIHTEGTIDDLGKPAGDGIGDPEGFAESNWFKNDDFWWQKTATDWAYTASWAPRREDHPMYTPVHRYARNIIGSLNHWVSGWIDWNPVLDANGGPNHVGNFCGAPIMIDLNTQEVYYTPVFHVLSQFSRTIRPGDQVITSRLDENDLPDDALHALATMSPSGLVSVQLLNTQATPINVEVALAGQFASITLPANALQTLQVQVDSD